MPSADDAAAPRYPGADWKPFFEAIGPENYLRESFTQNTAAEVTFLIDALSLAPGMRVLDVGCGPGRHTLEMARRGLSVTGVDFTERFIAYARAQADAEGLADRAEFVLADARDFVRPGAFDAAVCLCEGAFALLQADEDNVRVLRHIAASLKVGAPFLLTTLNGYRSIRQAGRENAGTSLDPLTMVETTTPAGIGGPEAKGLPAAYELAGRHYIVPELVKMHREAGLTVEHVWGGTAGNWGRRPLDWDEIEVMLLSRKGA
jgi:2-polyprenyl-3-methyl-5-hydroxy-6-metoxy-1,4-benzoquinol methylase